MKIVLEKNIRQCGRVLLITLLILSVFLTSSVPGFAATEKVTETKIAYTDTPLTLEMWHYSGGYWKVGNNASTATTIKDSQIGRAINIAKALSGKLTMTKKVTFNAAAKAKIQEGDTLLCKVVENGVPLYKIFDTSAFKGTPGDGTFSLAFKPLFNISSLRTMDDYVAGMSVTVPLIDIQYGENHYSLYVGSTSKGDGRGYYNDSYPSSCPNGEIHPLMIADSSGKLKSGYTINNQVSSFQSNGYYVGNGTFKNGGAVGIKFIYPVIFEYYAVHKEIVEDKPAGNNSEGIGSEDGGGGSGNNSGSGSSSGGSGGSGSSSDNTGSSSGGSGGSGSSSARENTGGAITNPAEIFDPSDWRIHRLL